MGGHPPNPLAKRVAPSLHLPARAPLCPFTTFRCIALIQGPGEVVHPARLYTAVEVSPDRAPLELSVSSFPESPLAFGMFDWVETNTQAPADVFEHKLRLAEIADRGGIWGWHIAEHQGSPLSMASSPSLLLAAAAQRTTNLRMGALTWCLPWYNPYRLYNEICMLDQLTRGRLEFGVGRGVSPYEARIFGMENVDESRDRYREMLDLLLAAFQSNTLTHHGKHYDYQDVDLYNHPYQRPYPPLWFPSSNKSSVTFTAEHGYHTCFNFGSAEEQRELCEQYREVWVHHKDDPGRHNAHVAAPKLGTSNHVLVAPTDAEAHDLFEASIEVWAGHQGHLRKKLGPYSPEDSAQRAARTPRATFDGSPATVAQKLVEFVKASSVNYLLLTFSFGDLSFAAAERSLQMFCDEVMPLVRKGVA